MPKDLSVSSIIFARAFTFPRSAGAVAGSGNKSSGGVSQTLSAYGRLGEMETTSESWVINASAA
ncbi:MAG: hypothetical protein UX44_C0024G0015 [candidate division WWE3 bacterium GW2011_GWA1_46_21]|uniref:Uncharacterized protein n=1 Tax=candidate division WWE3 bacterium GW2011_GWA1_46_21 TaxID=1619107 RepID=A0A0G1SAR3_UNCKA|nr:MAG: hypothetical protein UX44_C0024G0015 [candidate division WWE3 bacterium GW2011_GWA1_46_21]